MSIYTPYKSEWVSESCIHILVQILQSTDYQIPREEIIRILQNIWYTSPHKIYVFCG